ncbi:hypothetical protein [Variovorax sp. HJSM1_2]|uniref:hypothetical protein n=1 Tax=Variovorax sp. HJSM1_2 TaxID=3366263 RepID=UPI003BD04E5A
MNDTNQDLTPENIAASTDKPVVKSPSRRRLIKLGTAGVPVVATLASSPAMAWHCRTASAWGSNMTANLTASQKANPAHDGVVDECWAISNWCNNVARSDTGISSKPWDALKAKCSNLYNNVPAKDPITKKTIASSDKYKYVTVDSLVAACAIVKPNGCSGSSKVVDVLNNSGDDFSRCIIVAQLNYLFPTNANKIQWCAKDATGQNQLPKMATGSYQPNGLGTPWPKSKIVTYLRNNYMSI